MRNAVCGIYSMLLLLYPRSLRESYGVGAVVRAFLEVVAIGIPARLRDEIPAAAPLGVFASSAVLYGLLFVLHDTAPLNAFMRRWLGVHCP